MRAILQSRTSRGGSATGNFASRSDLTRHVWAMYRLQIYPNLTAIARACGTSVSAIVTIIDKGEGRDEYLASGCLAGG